MENKDSVLSKTILPLLLLSALSVCLYISRATMTTSDRYWFLNWNLALAWAPLLPAYLLLKQLGQTRWWSWQAAGLSALWLALLPNSFYLVSDFVHLNYGTLNEVSLLYDIVLLMSFALAGLSLGCVSTYLVHTALEKRWEPSKSWWAITGVFLLCGLAVYLGRFLGWNSWDLVLNPVGLIADLSDRAISPRLYPNTFTITLLFFAFIMVTYVSFYNFMRNTELRR